jgi:catechol 2,3-dioxygenase
MAATDHSPHVGHVALRVSDPDRSSAFYQHVTGMAEQRRDDEGVWLGARAGGAPLLRLTQAAQPGMAPQRATGLFHTAFLYPTRSELAATLQRLVRDRIPISGASDHGVSEAIYLDDLDGIGIELYWDRPRQAWPPPAAPGEKVGMFTMPLDAEGLLATAGDEADSGGLAIGHAHLKVADLDRAEDFWTNAVGFDLMQRFGGQASFVSSGGYHHHVGMNTWLSAGAPQEPQDGPGLQHVAVAFADEASRDAAAQRIADHGGNPDGVGVELLAGG